MRLALGIEYDGSAYHGWQRQPNVIGVQQQLEEALSSIANHPIRVSCAGRTDAGVHALEQVVHFDTKQQRSAQAWVIGTNTKLPGDIRVKWVRPVPAEFHARYSALARQYRYLISNTGVNSALLRQRALWVPKPLDVSLMHEAGQLLLGEHDFSSLRGRGCQAKSPRRKILTLAVTKAHELVSIEVKANAFLLHMVRNIAGLLLKIGEGTKPLAWVLEVLAACDRRLAAPTAPAWGLYLTAIDYGSQSPLGSASSNQALVQSLGQQLLMPPMLSAEMPPDY